MSGNIRIFTVCVVSREKADQHLVEIKKREKNAEVAT